MADGVREDDDIEEEDDTVLDRRAEDTRMPAWNDPILADYSSLAAEFAFSAHVL